MNQLSCDQGFPMGFFALFGALFEEKTPFGLGFVAGFVGFHRIREPPST
jgi:hypothetical protein